MRVFGNLKHVTWVSPGAPCVSTYTESYLESYLKPFLNLNLPRSFNSQFTKYVSRCPSFFSPILSHPTNLELKISAHQILKRYFMRVHKISCPFPQSLLCGSAYSLWLCPSPLLLPVYWVFFLPTHPSNSVVQKIQKPGW